jgi:hypothetical protein
VRWASPDASDKSLVVTYPDITGGNDTPKRPLLQVLKLFHFAY